MKMFFRAALLAAGLLAPGLTQAADPPKDPEVFRIGALLAMTGKADWYGTVMSRGAQLAVDEINAKGGVGGVKLALDIGDHKSGVAKEGVSEINRLSNLYNVQAVLTSFSPPTLAVAPIADEKGILLINGGGVSNNLVGASKYLFHNRSLASDLGRAAVAYANDRGLKKMAQLQWKTDAGDNIVAAVEPYFKKMGGTVAAREAMDVGASNIDTQIAKIRASSPDFVALWLFSPDPGTAMKRIRELGMKQPVMGIEYTPDVQKLGGEHMEGYEFVSDYFDPNSTDKWAKDFAAAYKQKHGENPEFYAANYYEAVYLIAEAIKRAREQGGDYYKGANLAATIKANPKFPSVYGGEMTFQENGVAQKRVALFKVEKADKQFQRYLEIK